MPDAATLDDARFGLAGTSLLFQPQYSTLTSPEALAKPTVVIAEPEQRALLKVTIRREGPNISAEIHATATMPRSFVPAIHGIVDLLTLQPGWNSYSAKPIPAPNAVRAVQLLAEFLDTATPPPVIVPTVHGGIQLEWHRNGVDIEIYIESPEDVSFFAQQVGSVKSVEEPLLGHEENLRTWLKRVSAE